MRQLQLPMIEMAGVAATRGMLGAGLALLLGENLPRDERRKLGFALAVIGLLSTFPFAYDLLHRRLPADE
jgi:hypothetical protein